MIDFHVHFGNCFRNMYPQRPPLTPEQVIDRMNRQGVEISVLLPLESPEVMPGYFLTEQAIEARDHYPERFIAFMGIDPRQRNLEEQFDTFVNIWGCKGFGELLNGLPFNDERNRAIYAKCDEYGFPLVFDMCSGCLTDEVGLPGLEACLRDFPNCIFCGHGPLFWTAISGDDDRTGGYPDGLITPGGAIDSLMEEYDNLYLDLSAGSGYNAMTRDPEFAQGFIKRHWARMLFATDYFIVGQELPQFEWFAHLDITDEMRQAIGDGNARRILRLDDQ